MKWLLNCSLVQAVFIQLFLLSQYQSLQIIAFINNTDKNLTVFTSNTIEEYFIDSPGSCCKINKLFHEHSEHSITNFTIILDVDKDKEFSPDTITANVININHTPVPINKFAIESYPSILQLQLFNVCLIAELNSSSFDLTQLVEVTFQSNHTSYRFNYIEICKHRSRLIIRLMMTLFLMSLMLIIVFLTAHLGNETSLIIKHKSIIYFEWWYGSIFLVLGLFLVMLIYFISRFSLKIISFLVSLIILGAVYKTSVSIFKISFIARKIASKMKKCFAGKTFNIKRYRLVSIVLSIYSIIVWACYQNWVLGNLLVFSLVFAVNRSIFFTNFTNMILFFGFFMSYDFFCFFTKFSFKTFYTIKALETIDQPIKLVMPKFIERNMIHPCYFISFIDIVAICQVINYSKCFDVIKGYTSYPYYKTSLILFSIGSFVVFLIQAYLDNDQIHLFPIQIIIFTGMIIKSAVNHDMSDFWNGKNIQGLQKAVDDIISNESSDSNSRGKASSNSKMASNHYENSNNDDKAK